MSKNSLWIRENVDWMFSDWLFVLSAESRLAWNQLLCYCKAYGRKGGICPKRPPLVLARQWAIGEESVSQMILAARNAGALVETDDEWTLTGWDKYQNPDPTNAERQARYKENKKEQVTESNAGNALPTVTLSRDHVVAVTVPVSVNVESRELTPREDWEHLRDEFLTVYPQADHLKLSEGKGSFEARVLMDGVDPAEIVEGAKRYRRFIDTTGKHGYVLSYFAFLKPEDGMWRKLWAVPKTKKTELEKPMMDELAEIRSRRSA